ncbi:tRNA (adenine57-N1/adenine58-N1)-methyltransferase catalytic subunit [Nematocida homosporus]|uniref:tRNA (adenine57-N1/adenine58-N1)-methyltransferase catalytic subunit n=1 Tax=Nematocida homosporus TaxID=1912981 RepID=UPI00221EB13D|nr:tRNA (adenine57-N1/adenine58-N1)-methyltransferase catalytic subunit [Nematocida homosporus]KAI5185641.1 tRNA (adenine57-N1/adenine58-N1)-methyltransferase catalytic subunit [Nematocida homosporus]
MAPSSSDAPCSSSPGLIQPTVHCWSLGKTKALKRVFGSADLTDSLATSNPFSSQTKTAVCLPYVSCDLWLRSSTQRTQILYRADVASILYYLDIRAGETVLESGTGTLGLTYALSGLVGAHGQVHTVECHPERYVAAQQEIQLAGLSNTTIYHSTINEFLIQNSTNSGPTQVRPHKIILDIPEPEEVLNTAFAQLPDNGRLGCFIPCIEQIQRVIKQASTLPDVQILQMIESVEILHKPAKISATAYGTVPACPSKGHTGYLIFFSKLPNTNTNTNSATAN